MADNGWERHLEPGETLQWEGRPVATWWGGGYMHVCLQIVTTIAVFMWGVNGLLVLREGLNSASEGFTSPSGFPILTLVAAQFAGAAYWTLRRRRRLRYAITDRRALARMEGASTARSVRFQPETKPLLLDLRSVQFAPDQPKLFSNSQHFVYMPMSAWGAKDSLLFLALDDATPAFRAANAQIKRLTDT